MVNYNHLSIFLNYLTARELIEIFIGTNSEILRTPRFIINAINSLNSLSLSSLASCEFYIDELIKLFDNFNLFVLDLNNSEFRSYLDKFSNMISILRRNRTDISLALIRQRKQLLVEDRVLLTSDSLSSLSLSKGESTFFISQHSSINCCQLIEEMENIFKKCNVEAIKDLASSAEMQNKLSIVKEHEVYCSIEKIVTILMKYLFKDSMENQETVFNKIKNINAFFSCLFKEQVVDENSTGVFLRSLLFYLDNGIVEKREKLLWVYMVIKEITFYIFLYHFFFSNFI